jgi:MYXO-CTERM domain-containing protein
MKLLLRAALMATSFAAAFALSAPTAQALTIPFTPGDAHQCHNPHTGGGSLQIDWDGLGFDVGNPHGAVHFNNLTVGMSTQFANFGTLFKPPTGNTVQSTTLFLANGEFAVFTIGNKIQSDILSITLASNGPVSFKGTQLDPMQDFTLTLVTTSGTTIFSLESIMGSSINFNKNGQVTDVNLRFCASEIVGPPPPIPEPSCLMALGLGALGAVRAIRRRFAS